MSRPRPTAIDEPRTPADVLASNAGWQAIHTALVSAVRLLRTGEVDLNRLAAHSLQTARAAGFPELPDPRRTRFCGSSIGAWQDALFVVNELPEWRFPDDVLC